MNLSGRTDDDPKYEPDEDGFRRELVGPWVEEKHIRLERYVGISRAVRQRFIGSGNAGATYIELFSGPGRARIREPEQAVHGSPLVAWTKSLEVGIPFSEVHVSDLDPDNIEAAVARLRTAGADVFSETGAAVEVVDKIVAKLNPYALHFAFLDPYNLGALPFSIIKKLAALKRMDLLIHVSISDLQRNLRRYIEARESPLDAFAPGWRDEVDENRPQEVVRAEILQHWRDLIARLGMTTSEAIELVSGDNSQRLYFLAFAARHERAVEFWEKIRTIGGQQPLPLG